MSARRVDVATRVITLALIALTWLAISPLPASALDRDPLRIGVAASRPPFSDLDDAGRLRGFDIDIAYAVCRRLGVTCELVQSEFSSLIDGLEQRRYDAIVASMSITRERLQRVDFTKRYSRAPNRFVARRGEFQRVEPADLEGKVIGVKRGTTFDRYATAVHGARSRIIRYPADDELFIDLSLGRLDAILLDVPTARLAFLATDLGTGFELVGDPVADPRWFGSGEGIAVRKGDTDLREALDRAIDAIRADGTYHFIQDEYFDFDIYGSDPPPGT